MLVTISRMSLSTAILSFFVRLKLRLSHPHPYHQPGPPELHLHATASMSASPQPHHLPTSPQLTAQKVTEDTRPSSIAYMHPAPAAYEEPTAITAYHSYGQHGRVPLVTFDGNG